MIWFAPRIYNFYNSIRGICTLNNKKFGQRLAQMLPYKKIQIANIQKKFTTFSHYTNASYNLNKAGYTGRMVLLKKTDKVKSWRNVALKTHKLLVAMQSVTAIIGKSVADSYKVDHRLNHTIQECYSYLPKWNKSISSIEDLYPNIHSLLNKSSPNWKQPKPFQTGKR